MDRWPARTSRARQATHAYEAGLSYGMQRYLGGNAEALAAMRDGSRNVGDAVRLRQLDADPARSRSSYGAEYANYDYLADRGLLQPARQRQRAASSTRPA